MIRVSVLAVVLLAAAGCQTMQMAEDPCAEFRDKQTGVCPASANADVADGWVQTDKGWVVKKN